MARVEVPFPGPPQVGTEDSLVTCCRVGRGTVVKAGYDDGLLEWTMETIFLRMLQPASVQGGGGMAGGE